MAKKDARGRSVQETVRPFLDKGETLMRAAEVMKGPNTLWAAMLGPIGYLLLQRPRHVGLTDRRLVVAIPPPRKGGTPKLDAAVDRDDLAVVEYRPGRLWTRLVVRGPANRRLPLNFARVWRAEAEFLHRKLTERRAL